MDDKATFLQSSCIAISTIMISCPMHMIPMHPSSPLLICIQRSCFVRNTCLQDTFQFHRGSEWLGTDKFLQKYLYCTKAHTRISKLEAAQYMQIRVHMAVIGWTNLVRV